MPTENIYVPEPIRRLFVPMMSDYDVAVKLDKLEKDVIAVLPTAFIPLDDLAYMISVCAMMGPESHCRATVSRSTIGRLLSGYTKPRTSLISLMKLASCVGFDIEFKLVPRRDTEELMTYRRNTSSFKGKLITP